MLALCAGDALATLGQLPTAPPAVTSSAAVPSARLNAVIPSTQPSLYTLHQVQLENGTLVQEYATPEGVVFAVSWRGPVLPDLGSLLGGYFQTFKREVEQARLNGKRGSPVQIDRADLVVRSNGRMRQFFGYAYAPDLIPTGVNIQDVLP